MSPWKTYADPPWVDPELTRSQRRAQGRARRDDVGFADALASGGTGYVVWMCADSLDAVDDHGHVALDACDVDDALPGPWEWDLLDLARQVSGDGGRAVQALVEGYQQALVDVADEPLHSARAQSLRRSRQLAEGVSIRASQSAATAARRLVSESVLLRHDRVARRWGSPVMQAPDIAQEMAQYRESLPEATALLLTHYRVCDALASDDGRLLVLLARGADAEDVIVLEGIPARPSLREDGVGAWRGGSDVQRVLLARETVPLVPVELTGWSTSVDGSTARTWSRARAAMQVPELGGARGRARRLGSVLGLLHAAGSDAAGIRGYVGQSRALSHAVVSHLRATA